MHETNTKQYLFYQLLDKVFQQQKLKDFNGFKRKVEKVMGRLEQLDAQERAQWTRIMLLKCTQLHKSNHILQLKLQLRMVVWVGNFIHCLRAHDYQILQKLIRQLYISQYGQKMNKILQKVGMEQSKQQVLQWKEPWYSRAYNFFFE